MAAKARKCTGHASKWKNMLANVPDMVGNVHDILVNLISMLVNGRTWS